MAVPTGPVPDPGQGNRTDLLTPGTPTGPPPGGGQPNGQPVQVPTGGPYGEAQQLQQAQQAVPLPQNPGAPAAPAPGQPGQPMDIGAVNTAAQGHMAPQLGKLTRPTERPHEPVNAGLPGGPPPQAGGQAPPRQVGSLSSMIAAVAAVSGSSSLSQLAARAAAVGQ